MVRQSDLQTRRELHQRIARLRRRIDRSGQRLWFEGTRMLSWKTYVRHYPIASMATSLVLGLLASVSLFQARGKLSKKVMPVALPGGLGTAWRWLMRHRPGKHAEADGRPAEQPPAPKRQPIA